jgi:hypothetical protein
VWSLKYLLFLKKAVNFQGAVDAAGYDWYTSDRKLNSKNIQSQAKSTRKGAEVISWVSSKVTNQQSFGVGHGLDPGFFRHGRPPAVLKISAGKASYGLILSISFEKNVNFIILFVN